MRLTHSRTQDANVHTRPESSPFKVTSPTLRIGKRLANIKTCQNGAFRDLKSLPYLSMIFFELTCCTYRAIDIIHVGVHCCRTQIVVFFFESWDNQVNIIYDSNA